MEEGLVAIKANGLHIVLWGVVKGEGIAFLVLKKDAGNTPYGKGVVVALLLKLGALKALEIAPFTVELL